MLFQLENSDIGFTLKQMTVKAAFNEIKITTLFSFGVKLLNHYSQ